jgi:hypothetical protein
MPGEPFVRLLGKGGCADTKNVTRTNFIDIGWQHDPRTGRVILTSAEDNLGKGAGGQAVQSFNLMFGFSRLMDCKIFDGASRSALSLSLHGLSVPASKAASARRRVSHQRGELRHQESAADRLDLALIYSECRAARRAPSPPTG